MTTQTTTANEHWTENPHPLLDHLETDLTLLEPEHLRERLILLDDLDAAFGDLDAAPKQTGGGVLQRAKAIRTQLEATNAELYRGLRSAILRGEPCPLLPWLEALTQEENPAPGPAFDHRDDLVSGVLQIREPSPLSLQPECEMVFYQPTPVRHVLSMIKTSALSRKDVLVDLGSGLGHVSLLASLLTGAESLGIEVESAYVSSAQQCARGLHQSPVRFLNQDARTADLSRGTVFYLYTPFTGSILATVLERLRRESTTRPIRICTLGPCTSSVAEASWLQPATTPDPGQITLFHPRP
jgi:hypothetical protein